MRRTSLVLYLAAIIVLAFTVSAKALQSGDFTYTDNGAGITITDYTGSSSAVNIPGTIGGKPVTSIGDFAFSYCDSLSSITIGSGITSIKAYAFSQCYNLTSVTIPNSVNSIGDAAFFDCSSLTSITIPNSVTSIGEGVFSDCSSLTSVTIGTGVTSIGSFAFFDCSNLASVTIGNGVTSIGDCAFNWCTRLTSVTIPNSVTSIGDCAFEGCSSLIAITVDALNPSYSSVDGVLLNKNQSSIILFPYGKAGGYTIPGSVTSIGNYAFYSRAKLTSVTIPNSVTSIGNYAFYGCTKLTSVNIPDSVTSIGDYAFYGCSSLKRALFLGDAPTMGYDAFGSCAPDFKVYYYIYGAYGFTSPTWMGYPSAILSYQVVFTPGQNGSISGAKRQTVNHAANCTQVTAVPDANYHFAGWTGNYTGVENPLILTNVTSDKSITANFAHDTANLTLNANGKGTAGTTSVNPLNTTTAIPILATPAANNHFVSWSVSSGSASIANAKSASTSVMLTGDHGSSVTITANFAEDAAPTVVPAVPVISATDGKYEDRVIITWKAVPTASSYEVYRNTTNTTVNADLLGTVSDSIFEDNTAAFGTVYYYFAKAKNAIGSSSFSTGNSGHVAKAPAVPRAVNASNGRYFDKIRVSWAKVARATSYLVFRAETEASVPNPLTDTPLVETTALFIDDFGDDLDITKKYYYWIAAKNGNATTVISKSNVGYLCNKGPAKITASNGTYSNRIVVKWKAVPGATAYDVWRFTDNRFTLGKTKVGATVTALEYEDTSVASGTPFYYKVNAKYAPGAYDSELSLTGASGKASSGASNPTATNINNGATSANITNKAKGSILYFSTEVPFGTTRLVATLNGTSKLATNDCNVLAKFANYPTVSSYNAKGVENSTNEILTVRNPAAGTWYFMPYGVTDYTNVTLTVNCYAVADIVLTQIPMNDLPVPFKANFKGKVVDESGRGIPNMVLQVRNPITSSSEIITRPYKNPVTGSVTMMVAKTDAKGFFSYSTTISTEGEHTFDFFFDKMPDDAKGTASHTITTRKGCFIEEPNNFFDFSAYLQATPVAVPLHADVIGLQNFLDTRNGWSEDAIDDTYETMWVDGTLVKTEDDTQLAAKLDEGLYMFFYGVEGAGVGNDTTTVPALSAVPFVVHVETSKKDAVLTALNALGIIDGTQKATIEGGSIGIVAVTSLNDPDEGLTPVSISLLACEQLELLAKFAAGTAVFIEEGKYSETLTKTYTVALSSGRRINVVAAGFVK